MLMPVAGDQRRRLAKRSLQILNTAHPYDATAAHPGLDDREPERHRHRVQEAPQRRHRPTRPGGLAVEGILQALVGPLITHAAASKIEFAFCPLRSKRSDRYRVRV